MSKFSRRIQRIGAAATQVRQGIEAGPARVEQLRNAVADTASQLQKLRGDITLGIATLRAETDPQLIEILREIDGARDVLKEAGVELRGVDLDLGPNRRVLVELRPDAQLDMARLRSLANAHAGKPALKALLEAIPKCQRLANDVELCSLAYRCLVVEIGLVPSIRMGWRTQSDEPSREPRVTPSAAKPGRGDVFTAALERSVSPAPPFAAEPPFGALSTSAVSPPFPGATSAQDPHPPTVFDPQRSGKTSGPEMPARPASWTASALERFKKMPDVRR